MRENQERLLGFAVRYGATRRPASRATVLISSEGSTGLARWV